jgi:FkbM family methyltransferase
MFWNRKNNTPTESNNCNLESVASLADFKRSYSQSGEDMIVNYILYTLRVDNPIYFDIGAFHAIELSNTYHFYERGSSGCCVEANPILAKAFQKARPRDRVVNAAASGTTSGQATFYVMSAPTLSTLSLSEAERVSMEEGHEIVSKEIVDVIPISTLLDRHFHDRILDFVSIDVEGMDIEIVKGFDFTFIRPKIFCVETLEYRKFGFQRKNQELIEFLLECDYMIYADTQINTIFVDHTAWKSRN